MRVQETLEQMDDRIQRENYEKWVSKMRSKVRRWDRFLGDYDLDELEKAIFYAIEDRWGMVEDYTVSVKEIATIFERDVSNIRESLKRMERKGMIKMVELRKTPSGQTEKRYTSKEYYEGYMADLEADGFIGTGSSCLSVEKLRN